MSKWAQTVHAVSLARAHGGGCQVCGCRAARLSYGWVLGKGPRSMHLIDLELTLLVVVSGQAGELKLSYDLYICKRLSNPPTH